MRVRAALALLLLAVPLLQAGLAEPTRPAPPQELRGAMDAGSGNVQLNWRAPGEGPWVYRVWRENTPLGKSTSTAFADHPPSDSLYIYLVTANAPDGSRSDPAVAAVPAIGCEIVSISTNMEFPYAYVHVHEECIGGLAVDRDVTWSGR